MPRYLGVFVTALVLAMTLPASTAADAGVPQRVAATTATPSQSCLFFTETQHSLCMGFRTYWEAAGGLGVFGYPLSEEMVNADGVVSQWFERARFEWHPGAWPARHDELLSRFGPQLTEGNSFVAGTFSVPVRDGVVAPFHHVVLFGRSASQPSAPRTVNHDCWKGEGFRGNPNRDENPCAEPT